MPAETGIATLPAVSGDRPLLKPAAVASVAVTAVALVFAVFPIGANAFIDAFVVAVLVVISATDIDRGIIPNRIVLPATGIVLLARLAFYPGRAGEWVLGAALGAFVLLVPRVLNASAFGMGDVKLALLLGATLGWGVALAIPAAFICVFPAAVVTLARGGLAARKTTIPFGPFLALGALIVMFTPYVAGLTTTT